MAEPNLEEVFNSKYSAVAFCEPHSPATTNKGLHGKDGKAFIEYHDPLLVTEFDSKWRSRKENLLSTRNYLSKEMCCSTEIFRFQE